MFCSASKFMIKKHKNNKVKYSKINFGLIRFLGFVTEIFLFEEITGQKKKKKKHFSEGIVQNNHLVKFF